MAEILGGYGRKVLVNTAGTITAAESVDFGVFYAGGFARLSGIALVDSVNNSTSNVQFRFQGYSGTAIVTSLLAVTSGGLVFSVTNPSNFVGLGITPVQSDTNYSLVVFGELAR